MKRLLVLLAVVIVLLISSRWVRYSLPYRLFWYQWDVTTMDLEVAKLETARTYLEASNSGAKLLQFPELQVPEEFGFHALLTLNEFLELNGKWDSEDKIAVVIQSSSARKVPYVYRTLASLLFAAAQPNAEPIYAAVLVDDRNPVVLAMAHPELKLVSRNEVLEIAPRQLQDFARGLLPIVDTSREYWGLRRQRLDYALALLVCLQTKARHCLVLEDDSLLSPQTIVQLQRNYLSKLQSSFGLLRLFRTDHFSGWEWNSHTVWQLLLCCGVGALVFPRQYRVLGCLVGLIAPLLVGKQYLPILGTGWYSPNGPRPAQDAGSVSSLAHVYPRHVAQFLVQELCLFPPQARLPVDLYIGDLLGELPFWETHPNLVEHVGAISSFQHEPPTKIVITSRSFAGGAF
ncbi:hypothetical protein BASA81_005906 [Batrachochytrium salamandrivorans]|nr:hypothetical protein BASA81_005906 [Batrachochytrium salamandrivorans]